MHKLINVLYTLFKQEILTLPFLFCGKDLNSRVIGFFILYAKQTNCLDTSTCKVYNSESSFNKQGKVVYSFIKIYNFISILCQRMC